MPIKKITTSCIAHDHQQCINQALERAETLCKQQGLRLTQLRKRVLELVWQSHQPLGAYDILEVLASVDGRRAAPPTVYRALDFLQESGLVHRIASLNAFIGCPHPELAHQGHFFICQHCKSAYEFPEGLIDQAITQQAQTIGFSVQSHTVEVAGSCASCKEQHV